MFLANNVLAKVAKKISESVSLPSLGLVCGGSLGLSSAPSQRLWSDLVLVRNVLSKVAKKTSVSLLSLGLASDP
jgi:hypothetical protein